MHDTIFVGMDVHKATISVAVADGGARWGGATSWQFSEPRRHLDKLCIG